MRLNNIVTTAACLLAAAITGWAQPSFTAQDSITISGTVAGVATITVNEEGQYNDLPILNGTGGFIQVATVNERTNWPRGYTVELQSLNAGTGNTPYLKNDESGQTDDIAYQIKYHGADVTLSSGKAIVTNASARTGASGVNKQLLISFAEDQDRAYGKYSDTLTLTIATKP